MNEIRFLSAILTYSEKDAQATETVRQYVRELMKLEAHWELIVVTVDDWQNVAKAIDPLIAASNGSCRILSLTAGSSQSTQFVAGIHASKGDVIALLPEYLQSAPGDLHRMLEAIREGADFVSSWRALRVDSRWNRFKSQTFNWLVRKVTGIRLHDVNSGLRVIRRELAESVPVYGDLLRFWPILAERQGFLIAEVNVRHLKEVVNPGDYAFGVYVRRLLDVLTLFFLVKFTSRPLRFFGLAGLAVSGIGGTVCLVLAAQWLAGIPLGGRPALGLGILLIVLGVQFVSLGLLGELIIFTRARALRQYRVKATYERHEERVPSEWTA